MNCVHLHWLPLQQWLTNLSYHVAALKIELATSNHQFNSMETSLRNPCSGVEAIFYVQITDTEMFQIAKETLKRSSADIKHRRGKSILMPVLKHTDILLLWFILLMTWKAVKQLLL